MAGPDDTQGRRSTVLMPLVAALATIYFLVDVLFVSIVRPVGYWIGKSAWFAKVAKWVETLRPYPTLVLFVVPLIVLEPVKPVGFYLIASGHFIAGGLIIAAGEILKITILERLLHISRDKLMTIPLFAWCYNFVMEWLVFFQSFTVWQAIQKRVEEIKTAARRFRRKSPGRA